jgi:hypothetical protein
MAFQDLVNDHKARSNPGEFRVLSLPDDEGFVVVPSRAKDKVTGSLRNIESPLAARISFPAIPRTDDELLNTTLKAVNATSGERVISFFNKTDRPGTITMGATNEVARDVLARAFRRLYPGKQSWHLYYDPGEHYWALNVVSVYKEFITASGATHISPVYWPTDTKK